MPPVTDPAQEYFKDGIWGWDSSASAWVKIGPAVTPALYNVTMTTADTEYSQALPSNTKKLLIKCRGAYDMKVCFTSGQSGTTYLTIPSGMAYWEDLIQPATLTLYFQCATAAQVAEITAWS